MILMDLGLHTLHDVLDKGNRRHSKYRYKSLVHATIDMYVFDATDHIPDSKTDMTLL